MKKDPKKKSLTRTFLIYLVVLVVGILIITKAVIVQAKEGDELRALAMKVETHVDTLRATRGDILACDGTLLATDVPIYEIGFDSRVLVSDSIFYANLDKLCEDIATVFPKIKAADKKKALINAREKGKYCRITDNVSLIDYRRLDTLLRTNDSIHKCFTHTFLRYKRLHPYGSLALRTLGFVGIDEETQKERLIGMESAYDSILRGYNGHHMSRRLHGSNWILMDDDNDLEAVNGNDIITTLDISMQEITEQALMNAIIENKAEQGCAIVMEVATGEIKAIANLQYIPESETCDELYNFAMGTRIEPGSTFKLASILALLENYPDLDINSKININKGRAPLVFFGSSMYDDHVIHDDGNVTIREVFEQSSNKGTAKLINDYFGSQPETYINTLYSMGLNTPLNTGFAGEAQPFIKHPIINKNLWSKTSLPWMSIGYELKLSPMQILTLYNAVANNGTMMKPQFVKEIRKDGITLQTIDPIILKEHIASQKTIDSVQSMMKGVVLRGTAKKLNDTEYGIAGKTGTAQIYNSEKKAYEKVYNVTFVGYFPTEKPVYSCIVVISKAKGRFYSAGKVAAPVFKNIADEIYAIRIKGLRDADLPSEKRVDSTLRHQSEGTMYLKGIGLDFSDQTMGSEWVTASFSDEEQRYIMKPADLNPNTMPDLTGMNVTDAVYLLENMGWNTEFEGYGKVVGQSVEAGDTLTPGGLVTLTLARQ